MDLHLLGLIISIDIHISLPPLKLRSHYILSLLPYMIPIPICIFIVDAKRSTILKSINLEITGKYAERIIKLLSLYLELFCLISIFSLITNYFSLNLNIEYPLDELESLAVDNNGNIYLVLGYYRRIQAYDNNGKFLSGWPVDFGNGSHRLKVDESDRILLSGTNGEIFIFNKNGKLISQDRKKYATYDQFPDTGYQDFKRVFDSQGNSYRIARSEIFPFIEVDHYNGTKKFISSPFFVAIFGWYFNILLAIIVSSLILALKEILKRMKYKVAEDTNNGGGETR
jgi:hypothetical protein